MTLPNFLIIGAKKAGTTSIYHYLKEHPDVYMSPIKEPKYFSHYEGEQGDSNKKSNKYRITTLKAYTGLFEAVREEKAIGEATAGYLVHPDVPSRIKQLIPEAKLIVSLRNPVDRLYSGYLMDFRYGKETRDVSKALLYDLQKDSRRIEKTSYYNNLKRYYDLFGANQIKVVLFDDLKADPLAVMQELYAFVGVDETFVPNVSVKYNPGGLPQNSLLDSAYRFWKKNRALGFALKKYIPKAVRSRAMNARRRDLAKAPPLPSDVRASLETLYRSDIQNVQKLIGRDLSVWLQ